MHTVSGVCERAHAYREWCVCACVCVCVCVCVFMSCACAYTKVGALTARGGGGGPVCGDAAADATQGGRHGRCGTAESGADGGRPPARSVCARTHAGTPRRRRSSRHQPGPCRVSRAHVQFLSLSLSHFLSQTQTHADRQPQPFAFRYKKKEIEQYPLDGCVPSDGATGLPRTHMHAQGR
jgi:hypothetical protein